MEETSFLSPTNITWQGHTGIVEYGNDRNLVVMFYNRAQHHPGKSNDAGRPVYEDVAYVRMHPPGERLNIIDRPAKGDDARRFPNQWNQFVQNKKQVPDGTPVDLLYPEYPSIGALLRSHGVHTVEQCASLSGPAIDSIGMGAQRYSNDAQKYLEAAGRGVKASQLRHELEERDGRIRVLERQITDMKDIIDQLQNQRQQAPSLEQVQSIIAGVMQRPQHLPNRSFDASTAMINANSPSRLEPKPKKRVRPNVRVRI